MAVIELESIEDPRLNDFRSLKTNSRSGRADTSFVAEGRWMVERLQESPHQIECLLVSEAVGECWLARFDPATTILRLPKQQISQLVGFQFHRGVLASATKSRCLRWRFEQTAERDSAKDLSELVHQIEIPAVIEQARLQEAPFLLACPHLADPENLGSLIRSAAAFGARGVIVGPRSANPFSRKCIRVSAGNVFKIPIVEPPDFASEIQRLKELHGFQVVAATIPSSNSKRLNEWMPRSPVVVMLGSEDFGLSESDTALADLQVSISTVDEVDSLNVSIAGAILMHHLRTSISETKPDS